MGSSPMIDHFADEPHSWGSTPGSGSYGRNNADVWEPSTPNSAFSPPVIALVAVIASAFLIVGYYRYFLKYCKPCLSRIRTRNEVEGAVVQDSDEPFTQNFGLDEAVMKKIPVCRYRKGDKFIEGTECAVCLLEFQENESLRVLPKCSHAFHVKCIDMWLKSNANCPLCRANVVCPGETSGRSSMDTNYRVVGQHPWRSLKSESPLFINTSSRLRSGDPEALLSPHRFYQRMKL